LVIVISADIQPEARARVLNLGAIDFIKKPIDAPTLAASLRNFGLL
jgi:DNA-binding response OmpR family regulator